MPTQSTNADEIIEAELSYQVMSVIFKVQNKLGNRLQEKYYQRAIELELKSRRIYFEKEKEIFIRFEGKVIGKYYLDFLIEKKIVLEVKTIPVLIKKGNDQLLSYMKETKTRLGIIANFRTPKVTYQRLVLSKKYLD